MLPTCLTSGVLTQSGALSEPRVEVAPAEPRGWGTAARTLPLELRPVRLPLFQQVDEIAVLESSTDVPCATFSTKLRTLLPDFHLALHNEVHEVALRLELLPVLPLDSKGHPWPRREKPPACSQSRGPQGNQPNRKPSTVGHPRVG